MAGRSSSAQEQGRIPSQPHTWQGREVSGVCQCCKACVDVCLRHIQSQACSECWNEGGLILHAQHRAGSSCLQSRSHLPHPTDTSREHIPQPAQAAAPQGSTPASLPPAAIPLPAPRCILLLPPGLAQPWYPQPHCPSLWDTRQAQLSSAMLMENTAGAAPVHLAGLLPLTFDTWHTWKCSLQQIPDVPIWEVACLKISKYILG